MKPNPLEVNLAALCVIALVSHNPVTVAHAKKVAAEYRKQIEREVRK